MNSKIWLDFRWYVVFVLCICCQSLMAATADLPTRAAAENKVEQQPPTVQALVLINHFLKAISSHNSNQAYYAFTSKEFRETIKFQDFHNFLMRFPSLFRNNKVEHIKEEYYDKSVGEPAVPGDVAVVESLVQSFDGQQNTALFVLVFEAGQWRIRSIEVLPAPIEH